MSRAEAHSSADLQDVTAPDFEYNIESFERSLRAENKAPATIVSYLNAARKLDAFLAERGMPRAVAHVRREHIEEYIIALDERGLKPTSRAHAYRSLQQFWRWLVEEGEIEDSPMRRMKPPHVPETPPPVLTTPEVDALLATVKGTSFDERRDAAILGLFIDSGLRLGELAGLKVEDVDFGQNVVVVMGKGRRPRACPFGATVARALDRYLRARRAHKAADSEWLWLGKRGRLSATGIEQMVRRRATEAGVEGMHPHRFRHTWANEMQKAGMGEGDLMMLGGWKSSQMVKWYGKSAAADRAIGAHRRLSPMDNR